MAKKRIATFLGPSRSLDVLGNHIYGYSGQVEYTNTETTFIESVTGKYYSDVFVQYSTLAYSSDDPTVKVYFNGVLVVATAHTHTEEAGKNLPLRLIIPPLTQVKVTVTNQDTTGIQGFIFIKGRTYDA